MVHDLNDTHIGKWVEYDIRIYGAKKELGKIKSFNNDHKIAFVVYHCDNNWDQYYNYTGAGTSYDDINFTNKRPKIK